jgi:hypothetical protein
MTSQKKSAIVRKASKRIENETTNLWEMHPDLSKEIVRIVLEVIEESAA